MTRSLPLSILPLLLIAACGAQPETTTQVHPKPVVATLELVATELTVSEDSSASVTLQATGPGVSGTVKFVIDAQPVHGALEQEGGRLTYTPAANYNGADSIKAHAEFDGMKSKVITIPITVTPVNDAPTISGAAVSGMEDTMIAGSVLGQDLDGDALTYSVSAPPAHGLAVIDPAVGSFTYIPDPDYFGPDSFSVTASDGIQSSSAATVTITVSPEADDPSTIVLSGNEDTPITGYLAGASEDAPGYTFALVDLPSHGTVTADTVTGAFTYTPNPDYNGSDLFLFRTVASYGNSGTATVYLTVNPVADAPLPADFDLTVNEDSPLSDYASTIDPDGDLVSYNLVTGPTHGQLLVWEPSTAQFTYLAPPHYSGSDSFVVSATDGGLVSFLTVNINVLPVNDPPIAGLFGGAMSFPGAYYRYLNVSSGFSQKLTTAFTVETWVYRTGNTGGDQMLFNQEGEYEVMVNADSVLAYAIANSNPGWAWIGTGIIVPLNEWVHIALAYDNGLIQFYKNGALAYSFAGSGDIVDVDPDQNDFYWGNRQHLEQSPLLGYLDEARIWNYSRSSTEIVSAYATPLTGEEAGLIGYWPFNDTTGPETDASGNGHIAYPTANLTRVSSSTLFPLVVTTAEDTSVQGTLLGSDPDGDTLTFLTPASNAAGSITINDPQTGDFTFVPTADFSGTAIFQYQVSDGTQTSLPAMLKINVTPVPDAWYARNVTVYADEDVSGEFDGPLFNPDPVMLSVSVVTDVTHGTLTVEPTYGGFTYQSDIDYNGPDAFTVMITDGLRTEYGTVDIVVRPVNDPPVVTSSPSYVTDDDTPVAGVLSGTDPIEGSPVTFYVSAPPFGGSVTLSADTATFYYRPNHGFYGIDSFAYKAFDGDLSSVAAGTVSITVNLVNSAPTLLTAPTSLTLAERGSVTFTLGGSDSDGDPLAGAVTVLPAKGYVTVNGLEITYHAGRVSGSDTIEVAVHDGYVSSTAGVVAVTITPVNDAPEPVAGRIVTQAGVTGTAQVAARDPDGDPVTYTLAVAPGSGVATVSEGGKVSYTPNAGFTGTDALLVNVSDGSLSAPALMEILVLHGPERLMPESVQCGVTDYETVTSITPGHGATVPIGVTTPVSAVVSYSASAERTITLSSTFAGAISSAVVAPGCGTVVLQGVVNEPSGGTDWVNTGLSPYNSYWFVGSSIEVKLSSISIPLSEGVTTPTYDLVANFTYDVNGDVDGYFRAVASDGTSFLSPGPNVLRRAISPDAVTIPVHVAGTIACGKSTLWLYARPVGGSGNSAYLKTAIPAAAPLVSSTELLTEYPVNGVDSSFDFDLIPCANDPVYKVTASESFFSVSPTLSTLQTFTITYHGSQIQAGERKEGWLIVEPVDGSHAPVRFPVSAVGHDIDFSNYQSVALNYGVANLALPFAFPADGAYHETIEVTHDGLIVFGSGLSTKSRTPVDALLDGAGLSLGKAVFAPWWGYHFLNPNRGSYGNVYPSNVYTREATDVTGHHFELLYWDLGGQKHQSTHNVFRVKLYPDGTSQVIYDQLFVMGTEIVGFMNSDGSGELLPPGAIKEGDVKTFGPYY